MRSVIAVSALAGALVLSLSWTCAAQEAAGKGKKKGAANGANHAVFQLVNDVSLTEEQQARLDALKKEHGPRLAELQKKADEILTAEQRQARREAAAKAKADKLTGKESQAAVNAALKLTDEQKAKWDAAQKELQAAVGKVREKLADILTDEQKAKIPALARKKKAA